MFLFGRRHLPIFILPLVAVSLMGFTNQPQVKKTQQAPQALWFKLQQTPPTPIIPLTSLKRTIQMKQNTSNSAFQMTTVSPDSTVAYKMHHIQPDSLVDYTMSIVEPDAQARKLYDLLNPVEPAWPDSLENR